MQNILNGILSILVLSVALSFAMIRSYLVKNKLAEHKIYYWNPVTFFRKYIVQTKKKDGQIGMWFWIFILSFSGILLVGASEGILELVNYLSKTHN
jgi:hypothetical protein